MGGFSGGAPPEAVGFWAQLVNAATGTAEARSIFIPGMMAIVAVPMRFFGEVFKRIPDAIMPPEAIPVILMLLGWIAGYALGYYTPIPQDVAATIGAGAGLGSKVAHDSQAMVKRYRDSVSKQLK